MIQPNILPKVSIHTIPNKAASSLSNKAFLHSLKLLMLPGPTGLDTIFLINQMPIPALVNFFPQNVSHKLF